MSVASIMTRKVVTVEMDDTLLTIRMIFQHVKFHHLVVVGNRKPVGVISDRDVLKAVFSFIWIAHEILSVPEYSLCQYMIFNVISATRNLTNIFGAHRNGKNCFVRLARVKLSKRYFPYLACL